MGTTKNIIKKTGRDLRGGLRWLAHSPLVLLASLNPKVWAWVRALLITIGILGLMGLGISAAFTVGLSEGLAASFGSLIVATFIFGYLPEIMTGKEEEDA